MFRSEKPVTAITVLIERLTKEEYEIDDLSDLPTLIEAIRLQSTTGPTEASRAIRKKLKYGSSHRQLRALVILDDLIQNAGTNFQRRFADEPLLERLRVLVNEQMTEPEIKQKCNELYRQWAVSYKDTPGMAEVAQLYRQLPKRKAPRQTGQAESKPPRPTLANEDSTSPPARPERERSERERSDSLRQAAAAGNAGSSGGSSLGSSFFGNSPTSPSSKRDRKGSKTKVQPFNFAKERQSIINIISAANLEATGLMNTLTLFDKDKSRVSGNRDLRHRYEVCKGLHRQTLRYCSLVTEETFLGALLKANDQISEVIKLYEQLDRSFDYDSDSEDYDDEIHNAAASPATTASRPAIPSHVNASPPPISRLVRLSLEEQSPPQPRRPPVAATATATGAGAGAGAGAAAVMVPSAADLARKGKQRAASPAAAQEPEAEEDDEDDPFADRNAV